MLREISIVSRRQETPASELASGSRSHYTEPVTRTFSPLNDRQLEVLRWIGDGCPDGVMEGYSYKTTAVALRNRRLVTVSKKGGVWRAVLTNAGTFYLQHDTYPSASLVGRRQLPLGPDPLGPSPSVPRRAQGRPRTAPRVDQAKTPSPTEQLISQLVTHGEVRVSGPDQAKYEARVAAAIRYGKVPEGKQLVAEGDRWSRDYVIRLQEAPAWLHAPLGPIAVPATLRKPHPVVIALQAGKRLSSMDRSGSHRALLLVQALAVEARKRGYSVKETKVTTNPYGHEHRESKDHFSITIGKYSVGIQLRQPMNRARHEATPAEQAKAAKDRWYDIPKFDLTSSDRLSIELSGRFKHRRSKWTDGRARTLENWLPQILQEVELRAAAAEHARLAAIAAAAERRRQWECAMERAKGDYTEAHRADILLRQVDGWLRTGHVRDYLDVMQETIDNIADPDDAIAAKEWHRWAEEWLASADPLAQPLAMPTIPEPKPDELKPFLKGWNPYGPERSGW
jgi:hypothetical protein